MNTNKILLRLTVFCTILIIIRNIQWGTGLHVALTNQSSSHYATTFLFLLWNLFLAWIPYAISLVLERYHLKKNASTYLWPLLLMWLLFLPNAPYILTDLVHLRSRPPIPIWFDMIVFFAFAWTGLMLGLLSMLKVERIIQLYFKKNIKTAFPLIILPLCAMGVYVGRFLRWNSWDVFQRPQTLVLDLWSLLQSVQFYQDLGIFILPFTALLFLLYWSLQHLSIASSLQTTKI